VGRGPGHTAGGILVKAGKLMGKLGKVSVGGLTAIGRTISKKK
jgi:hypothetical protein